jgi:uncharacterized membrane protein
LNTTARRALWDLLLSAGLVQGDLPTGATSPWFVRVMLGFAGWIGAIFIFGFIGTGFAVVMRSAGSAAVAAIICCGGAYAIFRAASRGDFANQFGLATGIAGQALFAVAIFQDFRGQGFMGYALLFCVEAVLTVLIPNFVHRVFTTVGAVAALSIGLAHAGLYALALPAISAACALVWRGEQRLAARIDLWQPVAYGLALGVLQTATTSLLNVDLRSIFPRGSVGWLQGVEKEIATALVAVVFLAVTRNILQQLEIESASKEGVALMLCALLFLGVSFPAQSLSAAALILILGFAGGNRVLFGLGLLGMTSFLSHYYYQMQQTLLTKSIILCSSGALLLLVRWGIRAFFPVKEAGRGA